MANPSKAKGPAIEIFHAPKKPSPTAIAIVPHLKSEPKKQKPIANPLMAEKLKALQFLILCVY